MADDWWQNDPVAGTQPTGRVGYIPGVPKAKDPLDAEAKALDIESKKLSIQKTQQELANPGGGDKVTGDERLSGGYYLRALNANKMYGKGVEPRNAVTQTVVDMLPQGVVNSASSPERRAADNYAEEFIRAKLRKESGASISPQEKATEYPVYFPMPGDTQADLERKAQLREVVIQGLRMAAGGAAAEADAALGQQPGASLNDQGNAVYDDSQNPGNIGLATNGTHQADNPALKGVNAQVNQMLKNGASDKEILDLLKSRGADTAALVSVKSQLNDIRKFQKGPGRGYKGDYNVSLEQYDAPNSGWQDLAMSPVGAGALAAADTFTGGHLDNIVGAAGGDAELANLGIQLSREQNPGASLAGDIAGGVGAYATGSAALRAAGVAPQVGRIGALAPRALAGDAALGGYVSSGQGGTQIIDPAQTAQGAVLGAATGAGTRGLLNGVGAAVSPTGGDLAPLYEAGVRPTIGQRLGAADNFAGKSLNRAEQAFGSVPIIGGIQRAGRNAAVTEMQRGAFNDALGDLAPFDAVLGRQVSKLPKGVSKGKQAHLFMQKAADDAYEAARSGMSFRLDDEFVKDIDALAEDAGALFPESQAVVKNMANGIGSKIAAKGGTLDGEQFKAVVSRLDKKVKDLRSNPRGDTELADVLDSMKTAIENAARRHSNPESVKLLDAADRSYAKMVIIENAGKARGGEAGEFGGNALDSAVQKSDKSRRSRAYQSGRALMQKYGEAAKKLGDELPDSGTAERLATMGGAGLAAHYISPAALVPWAIDTAANLPGVRQGLGALMAPRPASVRGMTDSARHFFERLAAVSPAVTIPASE